MSKNIDLTHQKFGKWFVEELMSERKNNKKIWKCKCECGSIGFITTGDLRSGRSTGCNKCARFIDITNQKFGKLTAINKIGTSKEGNAIWQCQCECGNITNVTRNSLITGNTTSCGCSISKGEDKITQLLLDNNINFVTEKTFNSCRFPNSNKLARFDFYLPDYKCCIEYDGKQHYSGSTQWKDFSFTDLQSRDMYKNQWCEKNNISLIRIPYTHYDKLKIQDLLLSSSNFIITKGENCV